MKEGEKKGEKNPSRSPFSVQEIAGSQVLCIDKKGIRLSASGRLHTEAAGGFFSASPPTLSSVPLTPEFRMATHPSRGVITQNAQVVRWRVKALLENGLC